MHKRESLCSQYYTNKPLSYLEYNDFVWLDTLQQVVIQTSSLLEFQVTFSQACSAHVKNILTFLIFIYNFFKFNAKK
jgi:hypothetical protein